MRIELPWPPSVNHYWGQRVVMRPGRKPFVLMYLTSRAKAYREAVLQAWLSSVPCMGDVPLVERPMFAAERLAVQISLHPPNRRKFDIDNVNKAVLDSCTHARVWADDGQIDDLHLMRGEIVEGGAVVVEVEKIFTEPSR